MAARKSHRKSSRQRPHQRFRRPLIEFLELRFSPAIFSLSAELSLAAAIHNADANQNLSNTIYLPPGTYAAQSQVIDASATKTLSIIGEGGRRGREDRARWAQPRLRHQ